MNTELDRGISIVRATLKAHSKRSLNTATVARELGIAADTLLAFAEGSATLSPMAMSGLVAILFFGNAVWDEAHEMLVSAHKAPAKSLGIAPDAFPAKALDYPTGPPVLYASPVPPRELRPATKVGI